MKEVELMQIERITLTKTEYENDLEGEFKTVEFQFVNTSNYCLYDDEDVECTITEDVAIELVENLQREFNIEGLSQQLVAAKEDIVELHRCLDYAHEWLGIDSDYKGSPLCNTIFDALAKTYKGA